MGGMTWTRLRWRLRGAWMWPAFLALTVADAVLLNRLPPAGSGGLDIVPALLVAGFVNLVAIAVLAPLAGMVLRRRRRSLPREVARDYAGTALILAAAVALVAGGILHRPRIIEARRDEQAARRAVHDYVVRQGPPGYAARSAYVDLFATDEEDYYRGCVPGPRPNRSLCVFVDTSTDPPGVTRDTSASDNATMFAPSPG